MGKEVLPKEKKKDNLWTLAGIIALAYGYKKPLSLAFSLTMNQEKLDLAQGS